MPIAAALSLLAVSSAAGSFDAAGDYVPDPAAVVVQGFGMSFDPEADRFLPADAEPSCWEPAFTVVEGDDALDGHSYLHVQTDIVDAGCAERLTVKLPTVEGSYVARLWMRHGSIDAQMTVVYPEESGLELTLAKLAPTGRVTSDGWVELESNAFPVDGTLAEVIYLRIYDYDGVGSDIDTLELVAEGDYWQASSCTGIADPVCGEEAECIYGRCRLGRLYVPPLPTPAIRDDMVDMMKSQLEVFFGGRKTRLEDMPLALAALDNLREAETAWAFWHGWGKAGRLLHDWHTRASSSFAFERTKRLNLCFIEGAADASAAVEPSHPVYDDVLVSHVGPDGTYGIAQGDRLVAVDGVHPIEWALSLREHDWGWWQANDSEVYSELAERMRGLIVAYAHDFTILHCDKATEACDPTPESYLVADIPEDPAGVVRCDNRPYYHLGANSPSANHNVGYSFFRGPVEEASAEEAIYALVWDTLYGGGDPNGYVNGNIKSAYADFKQNARGVILDHRAGNGGTMDAAELVTTLVRPPSTALVFLSPIERGGWDGPATAAEGVELFLGAPGDAAMRVGADDYDPAMPVALVLHRDGSASDFMPFGMKGAAKVRIFGSSPTAGAFSTFYNLRYWGGIDMQLASGDTIAFDGRALIGHGVEPDVVVKLKQSDLLAGRDTVHEEALAWLRTELKP